MKILMLTPYLPYPPASGGQIRTLNLLKRLSKNHTITLISLYKTAKEKEYASYLKSYCKEIYLCKRPEKPWTVRNMVKTITSSQPFVIVRNYSNEARETVEELLKKNHYDVIHAETFYIMPHIPETTIPVFLLEQTIEYEVYQHWVNALPFFLRPLLMPEILKHKIKERMYWRKAYLVGTVSEDDRQKIVELEPDIKPVVIPNGAGDDLLLKTIPKKDLSHPTLLFVGSYYWLQNTEAALYLINKIFPEISKRIPNIKIIIAGQNAVVKIPPSTTPQIEIVDVAQGDIPLMQKLFRNATLMVAPIYGPGGTRLKILGAMASGLPVVTTHTGVAGLDLKDGENVLIAGSVEEFVDKIATILSDKQLFNKIQKNAFDIVNRKYSWDSISKELELVYKSIRNVDENRN